jgi:hypothetical protein
MTGIGSWTTATAATLRLTRRADALVLVCIALLVGVVTAGIVAAQGEVELAERDSLEHALIDAPPEATRLVVELADVFTPSDPTDPLVVPRRSIEDAGANLDPVLSSVYVDQRLVLDAPRLTVRSVDGTSTSLPTTVVLRVQPGLESHSSLGAGTVPTHSAPIRGDVGPVDVVEVSLSSGAAGDLGWDVGTELLVEPTADDPLFRGFDSLPDPFVIRVAALLELDDPAVSFWFGDDRLHRVLVDDTGIGADLTVHAAVPEAQLPVVLATLGGRAALRVEERRDLDPARIDMSNVAAVERAVGTTEASTSPTAAFGSPAVRLGLGGVLEAEAARRGTARDAVRIAAVGVIAAAIGVFVQLQRAAADRRLPWWIQVRARGAAPSAMVAGSVAATSGVILAGVLMGAVVGWYAVVGSSSAGAVVAFTVLLVLADLVLQIGDARTALVSTGVASTQRQSTRWRRAGAIVVVVLAAASVVSLRRSGIAAGDSGDIVVLLPLALVPVAVALVTVGALSGMRRGRSVGRLDLGVGRLVGLRRATETAGAPSLVVAVSVAGCVATVSATIAWSLRSAGDGGAVVGEPLGDVARNAFAAAAVAAWLLGVASVGTVTVITMRRRRADAELLAALGADRVEFRRAVIAELAPLVGVGLTVAAVASWTTVTALDGRLDLGGLGGTVVVLPRIAGATFAVMGSLFVVSILVMRLAVARTPPAARVAIAELADAAKR